MHSILQKLWKSRVSFIMTVLNSTLVIMPTKKPVCLDAILRMSPYFVFRRSEFKIHFVQNFVSMHGPCKC